MRVCIYIPSAAMPVLRITPPPTGSSTATTAGVRFWDRMARRYAASAIADSAGYERTLARVSTLLGPEHAVLEIGCGTGASALRLAPRCGRLLATDASPGMIAMARQRWRAQPSAQLSFAVADAEAALQEKAGTYHRVLAFNVLHLVDDLDAVLSAAAHALAPGGLFISKTPCVREMNPLTPRIALPLARLLGAAPPVHAFDEPHLLSRMRANGLEPVIVERHGTRRKDFRAFIVARKT